MENSRVTVSVSENAGEVFILSGNKIEPAELFEHADNWANDATAIFFVFSAHFVAQFWVDKKDDEANIVGNHKCCVAIKGTAQEISVLKKARNFFSVN